MPLIFLSQPKYPLFFFFPRCSIRVESVWKKMILIVLEINKGKKLNVYCLPDISMTMVHFWLDLKMMKSVKIILEKEAKII